MIAAVAQFYLFPKLKDWPDFSLLSYNFKNRFLRFFEGLGQRKREGKLEVGNGIRIQWEKWDLVKKLKLIEELGKIWFGCREKKIAGEERERTGRERRRKEGIWFGYRCGGNHILCKKINILFMAKLDIVSTGVLSGTIDIHKSSLHELFC